MNKIYWLIIFVLVVLSIALGVYSYNPGQITIDNPKLENFAKCLASKGATMYGAYWCSHCQKEKSNFGEYFKYVNYVECTENTKLCEEKKILGYPTWEFSDGSKSEGEQGLSRLSEKTGCLFTDIMATTTNVSNIN